MTSKDNVFRAGQVKEALIRIYSTCDACDVTDLITDIMHFCHQNEIDFDYALRMATEHFSSETN